MVWAWVFWPLGECTRTRILFWFGPMVIVQHSLLIPGMPCEKIPLTVCTQGFGEQILSQQAGRMSKANVRQQVTESGEKISNVLKSL